jgi:hypothetical protein
MEPVKRTQPTETSPSSTTNRHPVLDFHDDVQHRLKNKAITGVYTSATHCEPFIAA